MTEISSLCITSNKEFIFGSSFEGEVFVWPYQQILVLQCFIELVSD